MKRMSHHELTILIRMNLPNKTVLTLHTHIQFTRLSQYRKQSGIFKTHLNITFTKPILLKFPIPKLKHFIQLINYLLLQSHRQISLKRLFNRICFHSLCSNNRLDIQFCTQLYRAIWLANLLFTFDWQLNDDEINTCCAQKHRLALDIITYDTLLIQ